jgi:small subunit ribosomal protein S3
VGQKVHPIGFRLGIYKDWDARWFAQGNNYGNMVIEDLKIRKYLENRLKKAEISKIEIEKAGDNLRVIVFAGKPGMIIGKKGQDIDTLRNELAKIFSKVNVEVSVQEVKKPELDATLVAKAIASQLERRVSYKRAMKRSVTTTMRSGAKGIKICTAGRLQGAEIARSEWAREGSVPLHTLRSDIDYGFAEAKTTYGIIGVKVWICKGEYQHIR